MSRPPAQDWGVLGEDNDPIPGDPDAVALLGEALRNTADTIWREAGEVQALASVESWKSKAADKFRATAGDTVTDLRKAFHRYDIAAKAMGSSVTDGSTADWASALNHAQHMAAKALRDAQDADAEARAAQRQLQQLPPMTPPVDPAVTSLNKRYTAAGAALIKAKGELQAAKDVRDRAARAAAHAIHRAITHDGLHDSTWDKLGADVDKAASATGHFLEDMGETAVSDVASLGNAMVHDLGSDAAVGGGLIGAVLGAGGEAGGFALDLTGAGAVAGVPLNVAAAGLLTGALAMAGAGAENILNDAAGQDRVNMSSDGSGGGGGEPEPTSTLGDDGMIEPDSLNQLSADDVLKDNGKVLGKSTGRKMSVRTVRTRTDLDNVWDKLTDGAPKPSPGEKVTSYTRPDGTRLQYRITSSSGGETIDVNATTAGGKNWKIHLPKAGSS